MAKNSFKDIINSDTPVLVDFYADWCGPCKMFTPIVKEVKKEMGDKIRVIKIDVDKNQPLAQKLSVRSIPTVMIYKNGVAEYSAQGVQTKEKLISELKKLIN